MESAFEIPLTKGEELFKYYTDFLPRVQQGKVIDIVLTGENVVAVLKTGSGKTDIYMTLAKYFAEDNGITVVFEPTRQLALEQANRCIDFGLEVACHLFHEDLFTFVEPESQEVTEEEAEAEAKFIDYENDNEYYNSVKNMESGVILLTPEFLTENIQLQSILKLFSTSNVIKLFVVDEIHLVCEWGNFRDSFLKLGPFMNNLRHLLNGNKCPLLGLTGTATPNQVVEICRRMHVPNTVKTRTPSLI